MLIQALKVSKRDQVWNIAGRAIIHDDIVAMATSWPWRHRGLYCLKQVAQWLALPEGQKFNSQTLSVCSLCILPVSASKDMHMRWTELSTGVNVSVNGCCLPPPSETGGMKL